MEISSVYDASAVEEKWYRYWMEHGYFRSAPDDREPYTIVIPPPNVTGMLHMGHMLNNTIQDVLIRRARMQGKNACWVPGMDHASIATEAKVVAKLKAEGIEKNDLSREAFLTHAWEWKEKYGGVILEQLKKLGASCDWDRTRFTMEPDLSAAVIDTFLDLYKKGMIYRGYRMVNWDPVAHTAVSDEEVFHEEESGKLYHVRYRIADTEDDWLVIATTRPETILADTAICINPNDERFRHLHGKQAIVPFADRVVPIIQDEYVEMEFGTGCLKVTPAHDPNDYELGKKHDLEIVDMLDSNGAVNAQGGAYEGLDRFEARKRIAKDLDAAGHLVKVEDYPHKVGRSERTKAVIEPKLSVQWFCDMKKMAHTALDAVMDDTVRFHPPKFKNVYRHWMENVTDWCISRQLWWGQQIPAWHYGQGLNDYVVARTQEEALALAREKTGNATLQADGLRQDDDVVDTWFSSWLWPISVFDGFKNPGNPEIDYYYPTNTLVTGHDIIFFWVARMIMAGYEYKDEKPFQDVYFTGMVRDKERRKMSKQLGNSPDPLELIQQFGADGVRAGMLFSSPAGNDLLFDEQLCLQGRNFTNKIWNSFRLLQSWTIDESATPSDVSTISGQWLEARFQEVLEQLEDHYEKFRISDALMLTYKFIWDDYCSWYLELIKPDYQQPIDRKTYDQAIGFMEKMLQVLHPLMPFITEEIWQLIRDRKPEEALIVTPWPEKKSFDGQLLADFERSRSVIGKVRAIRRKRKIAPKDPIKLFVRVPRPVPMLESVIIKLGNLASIEWQEEKPRGVECFVVNATEYFISLEGKVDLEAEAAQLKEQLDYQRGFLEKVRQKLANERFVNNAPEQVVANERKKEADATAKIEVLESQLADLG